MKRIGILLLTATVSLTASGCIEPSVSSGPIGNTTAVTTTSATTAPQPLHSPLFLDGINTHEVISWFNEVCLDAEFVNSGDATRLQKWYAPIRYNVRGTPTDADLAVISEFAVYANTIEGFPGIRQADETDYGNLQIRFCSQQELIDILGDTFQGQDGGVTFWYDGDNRIYQATICIRNDLDQHLRNAVILEELYNGLGPIQDTTLRPDSIIYAEFSEPQALTAVDKLLLKLLYHPQMACGMDADECETVIRQLYY